MSSPYLFLLLAIEFEVSNFYIICELLGTVLQQREITTVGIDYTILCDPQRP